MVRLMRSTPLTWSERATLAVLLVYVGSGLMASCAPRRTVDVPATVVRPREEGALADTGKPQDAQPVERLIPDAPEPWQKKPPCDEEQDERAINGACWQATSRRPPCGPLWRNGDICLRPIAKSKPQPFSGE